MDHWMSHFLKGEQQMNIKLDLEQLQNVILQILENLKRPISQTKIHRFIRELFEYNNTNDEIDFGILTLSNNNSIVKKNNLVIHSDYAHSWDGKLTPMDEGISCYLLSLKEVAKFDIFFSPFADNNLSCKIFFKFVQMNFPWLLGNEQALPLLEYITDHCGYKNISQLYKEMNEYPTNEWFTSFFNNKDCRLLITHFESKRTAVIFKLILLPDSKKDCSTAKTQLTQFQEKVEGYFQDYKVIVTYKNLSMITQKIYE